MYVNFDIFRQLGFGEEPSEVDDGANSSDSKAGIIICIHIPYILKYKPGRLFPSRTLDPSIKTRPVCNWGSH